MVHLSKRLQQIADWVPIGAKVADIGTDHAQLPIYLIESGKSSYCIGVELHEGPYQRARGQVEKAKLQDQIEIRRGDGLTPILPGEVDLITIAGMGGALISHILTAGNEKLYGVNHLILQPNIDAETLRRFGYYNGWILNNEEIVEEGGEFYEILLFEPGEGRSPYQKNPNPVEAQWLFGPYLLQRRGEVFMKKWNKEKEKIEKILRSLDRGKSHSVQKKKEEFLTQLNWIKEVCL